MTPEEARERLRLILEVNGVKLLSGVNVEYVLNRLLAERDALLVALGGEIRPKGYHGPSTIRVDRPVWVVPDE